MSGDKALLDFSARLMAFYSTYVASQARVVAPSLLQSLVEGKPAWELLPPAEGEGGPLVAFCREAEAMGAESPGRALAAVSSRLAVARVIEAFGDEAQKTRWVAVLASGEKRGAYALSEPQAGSDATLCATTAELREQDWVIAGEKSFVVTGAAEAAPGADLLLVFARGAGTTDDEKSRLTAFLVPGGKASIVYTARPLAGLEGSGACDLRFDDVRVGRDAVLGAVGGGAKVAQFLLDMVRLGTAALQLGALRREEREAQERLASRVQFGHRLIELDMVTERLVFLGERLNALESLVALTARLAEGGCEIGAEAAALKIFAGEAARDAAATLGELGGGLAADRPHAAVAAAVHSLQAAGGSNDVARFYLAVHGSRRVGAWLAANKKARRGASWLDATVKKWWRGMVLAVARPRPPRVVVKGPFPAPPEVIGLWRECAGVTAERAFQVHDYFGDEVMETQFHLQRVAAMMVETWALTAVMWHAPLAANHAMAALSRLLRARRAWRAVAYASSELFVGDAMDVEDYAKTIRAPGA